jgi:hypothetical protein
MKKYIGIWIDHKRAFAVLMDKEKERLRCIESNVEGHAPGQRISFPHTLWPTGRVL